MHKIKINTPHIISAEEHGISPNDISQNALNVLYRLKKAGHKAYLVGGGVRDLLLKLPPKDFDIATDAKPEEIKKIFRSCLLIGRRFRLAHIRYGRNIIEVATFRADHSKAKNGEASSVGGLIVRDNVYGTIEEDVLRRDFTINALYYNIADFTVVDYCGGLKDLKKKKLKIIGDPEKRYQEDPVRFLRAIRLSAKLNFTLEKYTAQPLYTLGYLLHQAAPARLFEEMIKLFLTGHAQKTFELLIKYDLFKQLFPASAYSLGQEDQLWIRKFFPASLKNSDQRILEGKSLNPAFMIAILLWYPFKNKLESASDHGLSKPLVFEETFLEILRAQKRIMDIPRRFFVIIKEIWWLQFRFEKCSQRSVLKLFAHPRFRAAYDFLLLRAEAGEKIHSAAQWWKKFYDADEATRERLLKTLPETKVRRL